MSNTRFLTTNQLLAATLKNGTGGGAPALEETSPFVTTNVRTADRYTLWKTGAAPAFPLDVDFDFGSARTIGAVAILGIRPASGSALTTVQVFSASAYGPGPWTSQGSISISTARDVAIVYAAPLSHRYLRVEFSGAGQFSIGRIVAGAVTDLGVVHSPGASDSPNRTRIVQTMLGGAKAIIDLSDDLGRDISLPFRGITNTIKASLETVATRAGSVVLIDSSSMAYECVVPEGRLSNTIQFYDGTQYVYDCGLDLMRLP